jgi:hypothetical protein
VVAACSCTRAQDPGWPRKNVQPGGTVISNQPQVDDWQDFTTITWRQAFQLTPAGGKQVIGAAKMRGTTSVDNDKHQSLHRNLWRYPPRFESNRAVGPVLRAAGQ